MALAVLPSLTQPAHARGAAGAATPSRIDPPARATLAVDAGAGPFAIFWSAGDTWLADLGAAQLWTAPGYLVPASQSGEGAAGAVGWRYRRRLESHRPSAAADGPPARPSRWSVLERAPVGGGRFTAITAAPERPGPPTWTVEAEDDVLEFAGDRITLARFRRERRDHGERLRAEAVTLTLPSGRALPTGRPDADGPLHPSALDWVRAALPGALDACALTPTSVVLRERPGGATGRWLALSAPIDDASARCAGAMRLVALDPPGAASPLMEGASWNGETFRAEGEAALADIVDVRAHPNGETALLLHGPPLPTPGVVVADALSFGDPCVSRTVLAWRRGAAPRALGGVARLDGVRWLAADDPFLGLRGDHLRLVGAPCVPPLALAIGGRVPPFPSPTAELCRVHEGARAWGGPAELAAAALAHLDGERLTVRVTVYDPERQRGDRVTLWLGRPAQRVAPIEIGREGARPASRRGPPVSARWSEIPGGYLVEVRTHARGPEIGGAVRVTDGGVGGGAIELWAAGDPGVAQHHRPSACEPAP